MTRAAPVSDEWLRTQVFRKYIHYGHKHWLTSLIERAATLRRRFSAEDVAQVIDWYREKYDTRNMLNQDRHLDGLRHDYPEGFLPFRRGDRHAAWYAHYCATELRKQYETPGGPYCRLPAAPCLICGAIGAHTIVSPQGKPERYLWRTDTFRLRCRERKLCQRERCRRIYAWYLRVAVYGTRWGVRRKVQQAAEECRGLAMVKAYVEEQIRVERARRRANNTRAA